MRDTPILIPIILAICLGTMTYLIFAALSAAKVERAPAAIAAAPVVDEQPDPAPAPVAENPLAANAPSQEELAAATSSEPQFPEDEDLGNEWENSQVAREAAAEALPAATDSYIVLAGSFRQLINAEAQVKKLKRAGFADSEVSKSNNGAFAVAFVGRRPSRAAAESLLAQLKTKGFDARVVKEK